MHRFTTLFALLLAASVHAQPRWPGDAALDAEIDRVRRETGAEGIAIAVIDQGRVRTVRAFGVRNARGDPLTPDTVMDGASLTKTVFAYAVMRLVDRRRLDLDAPIASLLSQPLVDYPTERRYAAWRDLADDERWRRITPRHALTHSTGFANLAFLEEDGKLHLHFDPGTRYAYSGLGMLLLQFGLERGLGVDVGRLTDADVRRLGMERTSLTWRDDFAGNVADGWNDRGRAEAHEQRSRVSAAGSMDTTIADMARFAAALITCDGLSASACGEMFGPQLHIGSRQQFPTLRPELQLPPEAQREDLHAGLGVVVFDGPQGPGFFKGGHDEATANTLVCQRAGRRCVVILSNDVRAERGFAELVRFVLGEAGVPYEWEYGDHAGRS